MDTYKIAAMKARCAAYNKAHKTLNEARPIIRAWVESMKGQCIFKKDGSLLKQFAKTKPNIPNVWIEVGKYSIRAEARNCDVEMDFLSNRGTVMKTRQSGGFSIYFCDLSQGDAEGVVVAMDRYDPHPPLKEDYDWEECMKAVERLEALEKEMSAIAKPFYGIIGVHIKIESP